MIKYHKIQTIYKRDPETKFKTLLEGQYSLPEFEYLRDNIWVFTEKVDGTNIRIMYDGVTLWFGGKTDSAQIQSELANRLSVFCSDKIEEFDRLFINENDDNPIHVCLYSEGYGPKIQKGGGNYRNNQDIVLFDIKVGGWWLKRDAVESIANTLGLDVVPIIGEGTLDDAIEMTREGFKSQWGDFLAEGIVARPKVELRSRNNSRIITKIKHKDFAK